MDVPPRLDPTLAGAPPPHLVQGPSNLPQGTVPGAPPAHLLQSRPPTPPGGVPRGPTIGRFVVTRELGRGGMGIVVAAWDPRLSRHVAIKLIDPRLAGPALLARFAREASAAGRLRHPGVVQVLEVGEDQGRPFLVMDLVEGESLEALLRRERVPARRAVEVALEVARAVGHAHRQGVLHRDLKPANILIDRDGRARLTDFGIARAGSADLTRTGDMIGTPEYMAPEQAGDSASTHGPPSDVYALGATLYRALVGRPPLQADNLQDMLRRLFEARPPSPRSLDPTIDPALDALVMRCLEKDPRRRFADGDALAAALEAWLARASAPEAPRPGAGVVVLLAALGVLVVTGAALAAYVLGRSSTPASDALPTPPVAVTEPVLPSAPAPPALPAPARRLTPTGRGLAVRRVLGEYGTKVVTGVGAIAVSPDQRRVLVGTGFWDVAQRHPGTLVLRDLATGEELQAWRAHGNKVLTVTFCRDGARALSAGYDGALSLWRLDDPRRPVAVLEGAPPVAIAALPGDPERYVVGRSDGAVEEVEVRADGLLAGRRLTLSAEVSGLAALPDGRLLATHNDATRGPALIDLAAWRVQAHLPDVLWGVDKLAVSPDGRHALASTHANVFVQWRLPDFTLEVREDLGQERAGAPRGLTWLRDGRRAVLGTFDGQLLLWNPERRTREPRLTLPGGVWSLAALDDARVLIGTEEVLRIYDVEAAQDVTTPPLDPMRGVASMALSRDGRRLAVGCAEGGERATLHVIDLTTGARAAPLRTRLEALRGVGVWPDGRRVVAMGSNGLAPGADPLAAPAVKNVQLWDLEPAPPRVALDFAALYSWRLSAGALSPDGRLLVTAGEDGRAHAWSLDERGATPLIELGPPAGWVTAVAFDPEGQHVLLASAGRDGGPGPLVRCWSLASGAERTVQLDAVPQALACFGGADQVLVGFDGGAVERWSLLTGERVTEYPTHRHHVQSVAVSPDGQTVLSGSLDGVVRLSDARRGGELASLDLGAAADRPQRLAYSPDGAAAFVGTARGVVLEVELRSTSTGQ